MAATRQGLYRLVVVLGSQCIWLCVSLQKILGNSKVTAHAGIMLWPFRDAYLCCQLLGRVTTVGETPSDYMLRISNGARSSEGSDESIFQVQAADPSKLHAAGFGQPSSLRGPVGPVGILAGRSGKHRSEGGMEAWTLTHRSSVRVQLECVTHRSK